MAEITVGALVHPNPASLLLQRNIREAAPSPELTASVKAIGVQVPLTAVLTANGDLLVRTGHRRTLAAIEAKAETVPVYVVADDASDDSAEVERIIAQRDENTHRAGLTTVEEAGVVAQLSGLGLSAAQIAKKARIDKPTVQAALTLTASDMAREHTAQYDLTLEQGAVIAEFEDDPEDVIALVNAARNGQFEHKVQTLRDARTRRHLADTLRASLTEQGLTVLEARPSYNDGTVLPLHRIRTSEGHKVEDHSTCPGHVAWLDAEWSRINAAGEPVEEPDDEASDDSAEAQEAHAAAWAEYEATTRSFQVPVAAFGCTGWRSHGHRDAWDHSPAKVKAADMSEEEREEAAAARRLVIDNNKAWASAEAVRREWLATYAKAKTPPKGTGRFLATALSRDAHLISDHGAAALAAGWFGKDSPTYGRADLTPAKSANEGRCTVIALMQVLAAYEASLSKQSWREDGTNNSVGRYLRFLSTLGYSLSDVETYAVSDQKA